MPTVIDRLIESVNAHDLDRAASLFHEHYRSEQPAHPGRAFVGRAQMRANWAAMFAGIPDFRIEVIRSARDGDVTWIDWRWSGARTDGDRLDMRGVAIFEIADEQVVAGSLFMADVDQDDAGIEQAVQGLSGHRPAGGR